MELKQAITLTIHPTAIISDNFILILQIDTFSKLNFICLNKFNHILHHMMILLQLMIEPAQHSHHQNTNQNTNNLNDNKENNNKTGTINLHQIQNNNKGTLSQNQTFMVLFYVMNFLYWNKFLQLGYIISRIIQLLLIKKTDHIINENQNNNNNGNTDSNNNNINNDIENSNTTHSDNKDSNDNHKEKLIKLKTNAAILWFHIARHNISQFYL